MLGVYGTTCCCQLLQHTAEGATGQQSLRENKRGREGWNISDNTELCKSTGEAQVCECSLEWSLKVMNAEVSRAYKDPEGSLRDKQGGGDRVLVLLQVL